MDKEKQLELINAAKEIRKISYAPYSNFYVGAALLTKSGKIFAACNVENVSYPASACSERNAFVQAIAKGEREFEAIAIVGGDKNEDKLKPCPPCGICVQVMLEFCDLYDFEIILLDETQDSVNVFKLKELSPYGFNPSFLK